MTDLNHAHRTGTNRLRRAVCHYPGCTAYATTEATWLQAWSHGETYTGTWRPTCDACALDDAHQRQDDRPGVIGITLRPIAVQP